ncbi:hypothetical protein F4778DRAFT_169704 [Xylariomycetidae sp. FL2044]|nr:hypothetical protein F4778DRAFT_169704 [Xylariomycetidae sp. FL2044]
MHGVRLRLTRLPVYPTWGFPLPVIWDIHSEKMDRSPLWKLDLSRYSLRTATWQAGDQQRGVVAHEPGAEPWGRNSYHSTFHWMPNASSLMMLWTKNKNQAAGLCIACGFRHEMHKHVRSWLSPYGLRSIWRLVVTSQVPICSWGGEAWETYHDQPRVRYLNINPFSTDLVEFPSRDLSEPEESPTRKTRGSRTFVQTGDGSSAG